MNAPCSTYRALTKFLCGVLLLSGATAVHAQGPGKGVVPAAANADQMSFDRPLNWLYEAKTNYSAVKDYSCTLVTQEKVNGKMGDQNIIAMKFMAPFNVHMRWLAPKKDQGQEVAFVQGKNNNKMRVKSAILPIGYHSIDVTDPRVLQNSRHTILEAGIGNMIDSTIRSWEIERSLGKTRVMPPVEAKYNQRDCIKIEVVRLEKNHAQLPHYRTVIYLEKVSKMPIRLENYDWPHMGGPAEGEKLEEFSYVNLQFNTGLKEAEFNK